MSRKNRSRKAARRPVPDSRPTATVSRAADPVARAKALAAVDGYSNAAAFLGMDSPLMAAGTYLRSGITSNPTLLTTAYREYWLATRIIDTPPQDMTRAWISLTADFPEEDLKDLNALISRHSVKQELTDALRWARLYGGAVALMVIDGHEGFLAEPLDPDTVMPGSFCGLLVRDRLGVTPSPELEDDLNDPDFGYPMYYDLQAEAGAPGDRAFLRVHHTEDTGGQAGRDAGVSKRMWSTCDLSLRHRVQVLFYKLSVLENQVIISISKVQEAFSSLLPTTLSL